ncbi:hypothetical protein [Streptomyces sp. NPDC006552]|uniref:hypothetical protein n=1 Tax=Streptomyces sp. NPDC006552 TaxID=3157179 RepID=UPI0033A2FDA5
MRRTTSWPTSAVATAVLALAVTPVCAAAPAWADGDDRPSGSSASGVPAPGTAARAARTDDLVGDDAQTGDGALPQSDSLGESGTQDEPATEGDTATDADPGLESELVPDGDSPAEGDVPSDDTVEGDSASDIVAPDGLDTESAAPALELSPADARPGTTVTANTTACGKDPRATGDANSLGAGDFPLETGTHDGDLVGRFVVPADAPSGTFPVTVSCAKGTEARARLTVTGGRDELHGVHAGDGGSLGRFSTTQLVLGWMLITGSAGAAAYYVRRRHQDGWP